MLEDLRWRGLIEQVSDEAGLADALRDGSVSLYAGYDPTASSLHVGNLQIVMLQRRFQLAGHRIIVLSGGGTGLIGDPSGKVGERQLSNEATVRSWTSSIRGQLERLFAWGEEELLPPVFEDNVEWIGALSAVDLLRDVGKHFPLGYMLAKESVSSRLGDSSKGISFTEFAYMLLQALDFQVLYDRHECRLQVGGSDQWGNISAGLELLRRTERGGAFGLTAPLIVRSDGQKFGKSEQGAVWLDPDRTAPFGFYQYFLNVRDADVEAMLKRLSLRGREEIDELLAEVLRRPERRIAQRALAEEMTRFVHGEDGLEEAREVTDWLFEGSPLRVERELERAIRGANMARLDPHDWRGWDRVVLEAGLARSTSDARRKIEAGGVYVNDRRIAPGETAWDRNDFSDQGVAVLRVGKRLRALVRLGAD